MLRKCELLMCSRGILQADQAGMRASMARPKQVPRMLASISEDNATGASASAPMANQSFLWRDKHRYFKCCWCGMHVGVGNVHAAGSLSVLCACCLGLGTGDPELISPLATTRVYPDRGRSTFSPPDNLRDSMALFLQVPTPLIIKFKAAAQNLSTT